MIYGLFSLVVFKGFQRFVKVHHSHTLSISCVDSKLWCGAGVQVDRGVFSRLDQRRLLDRNWKKTDSRGLHAVLHWATCHA